MIIVATVHIYWLILPLVIAISIVYSASRHESWARIWMHSFRLALWIVGSLAVATAILLLINTQV
jgi:type II secretory pathway component PulF